MKRILNLVNALEHTALASLSDTWSLSTSFRRFYEKIADVLPIPVNPLVDAHFDQRLKETAHSRILYSLLTGCDAVKVHFLYYFLGKVVSASSITIPYPDKNRIDLTIKGDDFYLIIENKVNGAQEQKEQIDRYVGIAGEAYPMEQIYVLYLNKDNHAIPSKFSLSYETKMELGDNFICKDYKHDILKWLYCINEELTFDADPQLKSAIIVYTGYLEEYFQTSKRQMIMNNKLDKLIIEQLQLDGKNNSDKVKTIEDELSNLDKLKERLEELQEQYQSEYDEENFKTWYKECVGQMGDNIVLSCENSTEFGFDFEFRKSSFRCEVSVDDWGYYWGVYRLSNRVSKRNIEDLRNVVLNSRFGFHNNEENAPEWVVSDYASENDIVERFITLASIIAHSKECTIIRK